MRYVYMMSTFPPEMSAGRLEYELNRELARRGHRVTVITSFPRRYFLSGPYHHKGKILYWEFESNLKIARVGPEFSNRDDLSSRGFEYFFSSLTYFLVGLSQEGQDMVLCTSPPLTHAFAALILGKIKRLPVISRVVDVHPRALEDLGFFNRGILHIVLRIMEKIVYRHTDYLVVLSRDYKKHLVQNGANPNHVLVIPNWGSTEGLRTTDKPTSLPKLADGKFLVVYAGLMSWPQDLETIVHAASKLKDQESIHFLLVGDGPQRKRLEKLKEQYGLMNLDFLDFQPKMEYLRILHEADACVVAIKGDYQTPNFPSKLLDIMACGTAVLANVPFGETVRVIESAKCGICIEPQNPDVFASSVLQMYENRATTKQMGSNGREYMKKHFTVESCADAYENMFSILSKR